VGAPSASAPSGSSTPSPLDTTAAPLEVAAALVPATATSLAVTDWDAVRARLGVPDLTSEDLVTDRFRFLLDAETRAPLLTGGLLLDDGSTLELDHGFTQDDVDWEARTTGPDGPGFVLAMRPDLDLDRVRAAIEAGVGPLADAVVDDATGLVLGGAAVGAGGAALRDDPVLGPLVEASASAGAEASYVARGCPDLDEALGPDASSEEVDALLSRHAPASWEDVAAWSAALTGRRATFALAGSTGLPSRTDLADRLALVEDWLHPEWARAFGAAGPAAAGGGVDVVVDDAPLAARLVLLEEVPLAVCADAVPLPVPTG